MNDLVRTTVPGLYTRGAKWVAVASYMAGGRKHQRWFTATTKKAALDAKRRFLTDVERGHRPAKAREDLASYLESWLTELEVAGRRPLTLTKYRSIIATHVVPAIGSVPLRDLEDEHIVALLAGIESRSSAAYVFTVLRAALNRAVRRRLIPMNPCAAVESPRVERDEPTFLDPAEAARMLTLARGDHVEGGVLLGLAGGLRVAETVAVRWSDIDLATGRLTVARSWWGRTKSGKVRSLILPASAVAALRRVKMRQAEDLLAIGVRADEHSHVATTRTGEGMTPRQLTTAFAAFCSEHGFDLTFHGLRHSNAVAMLTQGVDVKTAADRLGHDPAVLLRTYAHFIPSADQAAAERLDAVLG